MKYIANILTAIRIILSAVLLFLLPLSVTFIIFYALCGLTDIIDGMAARHFDSASHFGELLDSIADIIFVIASAVRLLPVLYPLFPAWWIYPVLAILVVRIASLIAGFIKYRKPCFLHTYFNKTAGAVVFFLPFFYQVGCFSVVVGIVCTIAFIASVNELVCILKMKKYNANCKCNVIRSGENEF